MPIEYVIDDARGVIFERWTGVVGSAELGAFWRGLLSDPKVLALRRTVADLREAEIRFTGAELSSLVQSIVLPKLAGRGWVSALVVRHPVQFGVVRQYEVFAETYSRDSIFWEPEPALAWILAQPPPA